MPCDHGIIGDVVKSGVLMRGRYEERIRHIGAEVGIEKNAVTGPIVTETSWRIGEVDDRSADELIDDFLRGGQIECLL